MEENEKFVNPVEEYVDNPGARPAVLNEVVAEVFEQEDLKKSAELMFSDDYKHRVTAEYIQLSARLIRLDAYLRSPSTINIPYSQRIIMTKQLEGMKIYRNALQMRMQMLDIPMDINSIKL